MFTGIIEEKGVIRKVIDSSGRKLITIGSAKVSKNLEIGHSVCVDGVCLTVVNVEDEFFTVEVVSETFNLTTIKGRKPGDLVNLESALTVSGRMGGHFVQGHVDCTGKLIRRRKGAGSIFYHFSVPELVSKYIVVKGSIAVDGVSLTVANVMDNEFSVALIPYTLKNTTLGAKRIGQTVNVEVDILSKYVERFRESGNKYGKLTFKKLREMGL